MTIDHDLFSLEYQIILCSNRLQPSNRLFENSSKSPKTEVAFVVVVGGFCGS